MRTWENSLLNFYKQSFLDLARVRGLEGDWRMDEEEEVLWRVCDFRWWAIRSEFLLSFGVNG